MNVVVECYGEQAQRAEATLRQVLEHMLGGLMERDEDLDTPHLRRIVVADDYQDMQTQLDGSESAPAGGHAVVVHRDDEVVLLLDAGYCIRALTGEADDVAALVHLVHRELLRIVDVAGRGDGAEMVHATGFEQHLMPVVEAIWAEYFSTRRAVWSLPGNADLLLPHFVQLLDTLPGATAEDLALAAGDDDLEAFFAKVLGRVTHLLQVAAHVHGYLAGFGKDLREVNPEFGERVIGSFLGARWDRLGRLLDALFGSVGQWDANFLFNSLAPEVVAAFAGLGLALRRTDDGNLWLEPIASRGGRG